MTAIVFTIGAALLAQADADYPGLEPWVFHVKQMNGSIDEKYVLVSQSELEKTYGWLNVTLNEPWLSSNERSDRIRHDQVVEKYAETSTTMDRRIKRGWEEHGGIFVDTAAGPAWVLEDEYELALRAEKIAEEAYASDVVSATPVPQTGTSGEPGESPGFFALWGYHIVIGFGALAGTGLIVWITMIRDRWVPLGP